MIRRILYRILKKDMIKKLANKHGEQFIDDVMDTFEMPTNFMDQPFSFDRLKNYLR